MSTYATLDRHLDEWSEGNATFRAVAETVSSIAAAGLEISKIVALGPLAGDMAGHLADHADGDTQKVLDFVSHQIVRTAPSGVPSHGWVRRRMKSPLS